MNISNAASRNQCREKIKSRTRRDTQGRQVIGRKKEKGSREIKEQERRREEIVKMQTGIRKEIRGKTVIKYLYTQRERRR